MCNAFRIVFTFFVSYIERLIGYFRAFIEPTINCYSILIVSITKQKQPFICLVFRHVLEHIKINTNKRVLCLFICLL